MRFRLLLLLCSLLCITAFSQGGKFSFVNYNTSQGLPDNNIQSLKQDSRGFLWVGTLEGLSRFDGKTFKNYFAGKSDTVVKANDFSNIYEYKPGHLVMNNYTRVICFNTFTEKFYLPDFPAKNNISIRRTPGQKGFYLISVNKAYILDEGLRITDSIYSPPVSNLNVHLGLVYLVGRKEILVQYGVDFFLYTPATRHFEKIPVQIKNTNNSFAFFRYYDPEKQELYFSDYLLGLYRYSLVTRITENPVRAADGSLYVSSFVYEVVKQRDGSLWFLTEYGINIIDPGGTTVNKIQTIPGKNNSLISNVCFTSCTDRENNFWIGTTNGISKLSASSQMMRSWSEGFATSLTGGLMSVVKGPDDMIYASVYFGKAYQLNPATGKTTEWNHPLNKYNWNLFVRGNEIIRTGTGNELLSYNTATGQLKVLDFLKPYYPDVELVVMGFVHSNGDEWYSANRGGGFVRKLAGTNTYKTYRKDDGIHHFSNGYYTSHTESPNGDLWFGVNKTSYLLHWIAATGKFEEIDFATTSGTQNRVFTGINAVAHDAQGNIWVAFNGAGLVKYMPATRSSVIYTINDGLPTNFISGLVFDNNNRLWLNTFKGLSCFLVKENKFVVFKKEEGLPDDYFSDYCIYFDKEKNELWTGSNSALIALNPDEILKISREGFPVYVDEIYINSIRYRDTLQNGLSLGAGENNLQFHFTGVDLSKGKDIDYSYKLIGADADWINTGTSQSASYSNLKPGHYTFRVRARHRGDNRWNDIQEPLQFTIATPWNKTWWFRAILILVISLVLWYMIRSYYRRRLERQKNLLEKQQAIEKERTRIATDMHDDFGASLSRIKFLSEKLQLLTPADPSERNDLEKISLYSDEMAEKMNEIVWALNQRYDSLGDLVSFCRAYASEYLQDKDIRLHFSEGEPSEEKIQGEVRRNTFLVMKEALRNIVKHAGATAVSIHFSKGNAGKELRMIISDNGKGIDLNNVRPFANGLENMKKRMADINGEFSINTENGTRIIITVPV
ncbi:MAG: triple tyrosine motif-containing protein [Bacteroidetes bacterium]|nr:triple tyrosine motif-containing protein [Bacteroidota bacterium]